jgi:hypothetical protein
VASWNLSQREVSIADDGVVRVNGSPLRFWHFTKLGPLGDTMTRKYAQDNFEVYELWNWYRLRVSEETSREIPDRYWALGQYSDGHTISRSHRLLYRDRKDLQLAFSNPYDADGFPTWLKAEGLYQEPAP